MKVQDSVGAVLKQKTAAVYSVSPDATVYDALAQMAAREIGALPVLDGSKLVGIVSERDYARKVILKGKSSRETLVREIMATATTIGDDCSVDDAMRLMTNQRVRHLPVLTESGEVHGIVSIGDLVKWIISAHEQTIEQLHSYIAGQY